MQQMYDAVRGTGAHNLVIMSGTDWGYNLGCAAGNRIQGYNVVYATHLYPYATKQPSDWATHWLPIAETAPVWVTEFGPLSEADPSCGTSYVQSVLSEIRSRNLSFTAWAWYVADSCSFPSLISDWNGSATSWGTLVNNAMP